MGVDLKLRDIFTATTPFVTARRKQSGGFGATPRLPATIEDTYYALNILRLTRKHDAAEGRGFDPTADGNLRAFLAARLRSISAGMRTTFQLLWCCRAAGVKFDPDDMAAAVAAAMQADVSLETWYYGAEILTEVLGRKARPPADKQNPATVLDRHWRSVDEAWMHMYLSWQFRTTLPVPATEPKAELIPWFLACQNGDGGFGFFPGTTSYIENCHACLRALAHLGAAPLHPDRAFGFLAACQTAVGGFGRNSRAAPFLDATWHGMAGLAILAENQLHQWGSL